MEIYITLDYELFFGKSGSVDNTIIKPTEKILQLVKPYNIKLVFFVDVGYLVKLQELKHKFSELEIDYKKITSQIQHFIEDGHSAELHIHPHWEDSFYDGEKWVFDTTRYKLGDFENEDIDKIVTNYNQTLKEISGKSPKAYRAGGWSAQPFSKIKKALIKNDVLIDSTVFPQGYYNSNKQYYDFRKIEPFKSAYKFSDNLIKEDLDGIFTEFPISSYKVSPFFFWKFVLVKLMKQKKHVPFGDGFAISKNKKDVLRLMLKSSYSVVSIDGFKASYLQKAFIKYKKINKNKGSFVIIGHPKAFSPYSLKKLSNFINDNYKNATFKVF